ncbi:MAG: DUF6666 family protein [Thermoguttaceae bacterium]
MSVTRTCVFAIVLLAVAQVLGERATAQSWQPMRRADDSGSSSWSSQSSDQGNSSVPPAQTSNESSGAWRPARHVDSEVTPVNWEDRTLRRPLTWQGRNGQAVQSEASSTPPQARAESIRSTRPSSADTRTSSGYRSARRSDYDQGELVGEPVLHEPAVPSQTRPRSLPSGTLEPIAPGQPMESFGPQPDGVMVDEGFPVGDGGPMCEGCGECGFACDDGGCGCREKGCPDWPVFDGCCGPWLRGLSVFSGGDAFKGPLDRGTNGNFGINEGLNLARPLGDPWGCGYQIGANFVQSDFSGAKALVADNTTVSAPFRKQYFATAGIFHRAEHCGLQWGVAYDYLHDIYVSNANLQQIRSETSVLLDDTWELGYFGAYGVSSDRDRVFDGKLDSTDMFCLYVRKNFECGGNGRIFGGATGNGDGLIGADLWVPLGNNFALQNEINYRIPKRGKNDSSDPAASPTESWGFVMQLVWYPGQRATCERQNPYRPMFNVADNSLFMVDRLAH